MQVTLRPHQQRAIDSLSENDKGQCIFPTGGGKTLVGILDAKQRFESTECSTIVVVAPRILLADQLCSEYLEHITGVNVIHVHSGETKHFSTTKVDQIKLAVDMCQIARTHCLIFTTYNSLSRIMDAEIDVDTIYFDEAHNSVKRNFFPATEYFSENADRCFFFTATRKTSVTINKPGMNDREVYGDVICHVSAPELVDGGYILPPKVHVIDMDKVDRKDITPRLESDNIITAIDEIGISKVLVCSKTTKQLTTIFQTDFAQQLTERGYSYLYITSKTGAIIDGQKVSREVFFETLNAWGKDSSKKFVCLHRSILSEGINVSQLEAVIFMRNMDVIEMTQTVGRVLRKGGDSKTYGFCVVPSYSKVGIATARALENVIDVVFQKGEMLDSVVRR